MCPTHPTGLHMGGKGLIQSARCYASIHMLQHPDTQVPAPPYPQLALHGHSSLYSAWSSASRYQNTLKEVRPLPTSTPINNRIHRGLARPAASPAPFRSTLAVSRHPTSRSYPRKALCGAELLAEPRSPSSVLRLRQQG